MTKRRALWAPEAASQEHASVIGLKGITFCSRLRVANAISLGIVALSLVSENTCHLRYHLAFRRVIRW